ncbi:MAG: hypothetical protein Q8S29_18890, partial [Phreatobacter sp.]|nr:hypothetical protein [Phreatobacter sp.]
MDRRSLILAALGGVAAAAAVAPSAFAGAGPGITLGGAQSALAGPVEMQRPGGGGRRGGGSRGGGGGRAFRGGGGGRQFRGGGFRGGRPFARRGYYGGPRYYGG